MVWIYVGNSNELLVKAWPLRCAIYSGIEYSIRRSCSLTNSIPYDEKSIFIGTTPPNAGVLALSQLINEVRSPSKVVDPISKSSANRNTFSLEWMESGASGLNLLYVLRDIPSISAHCFWFSMNFFASAIMFLFWSGRSLTAMDSWSRFVHRISLFALQCLTYSNMSIRQKIYSLFKVKERELSKRTEFQFRHEF